MNYEIIKFENNNLELEVNVSPEEDAVWLSKEQNAELFDSGLLRQETKKIKI